MMYIRVRTEKEQARAKARKEKTFYELFLGPTETINELIRTYPTYIAERGLDRKILAKLAKNGWLKQGFARPYADGIQEGLKPGANICKIGNQTVCDHACIYNRMTDEQKAYARSNVDIFDDTWIPPNP